MSQNPDDKTTPEKIRLDADVSPYEPHNIEAARALRLEYDSKREVYADEDGCSVRDEFGQPLG